MSRAWIAFYMGDYQKDTQSLTTEEHGAYFLLLNSCWQHGKIPLEAGKRAAIAKMPLGRWKKIAPNIDPFFNEDGTNKRASKEIEKAEIVRTKRAIAGQRGGFQSGISKAIARGMESKREANAYQPPRQRQQQIPTICEPNLNSKKDSSFGEPPKYAETRRLLESLDNLAKRKNPVVVEEVSAVQGKYWVDYGTTAWICHELDRKARGLPAVHPFKVTIDSVEKTGAYFDLAFPEGYDEQTGERLGDVGEANVA